MNIYMDKSFLQSRYPIICASMNQVSDFKLTCAAAEAGITPCILPQQITEQELNTYLTMYSNTNIILSYDAKKLIHNKPYINPNVKYIELFALRSLSSIELEELKFITKNLSKTKKIILKDNISFPIYYDALLLQGKESAGAGSQEPIHDIFNHCKYKKVIVSGAIDTPEKVEYYIKNGALAVSIGTLFAASQESKLSNAAKDMLIASNSQQLQKVGPAKKQGLIFNPSTNDPYNFTDSLKRGIQQPLDGIIYCGFSVDKIQTILPISSIVENLTRNI